MYELYVRALVRIQLMCCSLIVHTRKRNTKENKSGFRPLLNTCQTELPSAIDSESSQTLSATQKSRGTEY